MVCDRNWSCNPIRKTVTIESADDSLPTEFPPKRLLVTDDSPNWVADACTLPLAFAQVREDPWLDRWVVEQLPPGSSALAVASGGCTAAVLATAPILTRLHLVDPNPAQLALARLKLRLLAVEPVERRALFGHAPLPPAVRGHRLATELATLGLPPDALGPIDLVGRDGPDHSGRYERAFARLRDMLAEVGDELEAVLRLDDLNEQADRVAADTPLGRRLDDALDTVLARPNLVRLFGAGATANPAEPFGRHFARRIRHALATLPAATNPYLWQMLAGGYPDGHPVPWLTDPSREVIPRVGWSVGTMAEALAAEPGTFDFVHLSNILDWLTPTEVRDTLHLTWRALRPGGWTLVRQLNSTIDVRGAGPRFDWLVAESDALHARDRSFFYRALHLGRKR